MRFITVFILAVAAIILLSGCAASAGAKCLTWKAYHQTYNLTWGAVERIDTWRCVEFSDIP
jgi:uncharacterized protein YceK